MVQKFSAKNSDLPPAIRLKSPHYMYRYIQQQQTTMKVTVPLIAAVATTIVAPSPCLSFSPQSSGRPTSVVSKPPPSASNDGPSQHVVTSKKRKLHVPQPASTHHYPHPSSTMYSSIVAEDDHHSRHHPFGTAATSTGNGGFHILHHPAVGHHSHSHSTALGMTYDLTVDEFISMPGGGDYFVESGSDSSSNNKNLMDIVSAALLITGNTVGAGTMVLPEIAAGPGLGMSTALLAGK